MKTTLLAVCLLIAPALSADDSSSTVSSPPKPSTTQPAKESALPLIAAPTFEEPLDASFSIAKGSWTPAGGILTASENPDDKHVAVLHHKVGLKSAVIDLEFRLSGSPSFLVGCDGKGHVGRVVVKSAGVDIAEDSAKTSHVIASIKTPVAPEQWHHLRVEWRADEMIATLDDQSVSAKNAYFATPKSRSWLAVPKTKTEIRKLTIRGEKTDG